MDLLTSNLSSTLIILAVGIIIGAAISKIFNRSGKTSELQKNLEETKEQFENYQQEVGAHFQTTADLVNKLTESYREVHQHLSQGAQTLAQNTAATLENSQFKALGDNTNEASPSDSNNPTEHEENITK